MMKKNKTNSPLIFWMVYSGVVALSVFMLEWEDNVEVWYGSQEARDIFVVEAFLVGGLFVALIPFRRILGRRYEAAKVPISMVFLVIHFLLGLFFIAFCYKKAGVLSADFMISFPLFFLIFLGVLLLGIFSILRPISKTA